MHLCNNSSYMCAFHCVLEWQCQTCDDSLCDDLHSVQQVAMHNPCEGNVHKCMQASPGAALSTFPKKSAHCMVLQMACKTGRCMQ